MDKERKSTLSGNVKGKRDVSSIIIIIMLTILLIFTSLISAFLLFEKEAIVVLEKIFQKEEKEFVIPLEPFIINLKAEGNQRHYANITLSLVSDSGSKNEIIQSNISKIRDVIIFTLASNTYSELTEDYQAINLKSSIIRNLSDTLGEGLVTGVYITDIIVQ